MTRKEETRHDHQQSKKSYGSYKGTFKKDGVGKNNWGKPEDYADEEYDVKHGVHA